MSIITEWRVGDMAYIHTDSVRHSEGDIVKVRGIGQGGVPLDTGHYCMGRAYRILTEGDKVPGGATIIRVGNYWSDADQGKERVVGQGGFHFARSSVGKYALVSLPEPVDTEREERLKRIANMERELAELKKLEER